MTDQARNIVKYSIVQCTFFPLGRTFSLSVSEVPSKRLSNRFFTSLSTYYHSAFPSPILVNWTNFLLNCRSLEKTYGLLDSEELAARMK